MAADTVWITYAYRDRFIARLLYDELRKAGLRPLIDEDVMRLGQAWSPKLLEGVEQSRVVLLLVSPEAVASQNVQNELNAARKFNRPVAPVLLTNDWLLIGELGLGDVHVRQLQSPADIGLIIRDLRELVEPEISEMLSQLRQDDFSPSFIAMFQRLFEHQDPTSMLLHYSGNLTLAEVLEIEHVVQDIVRERLYLREGYLADDIINLDVSDILRVTTYNHPASTEVIISFASVLGVLGSSPEFQSFVINVFSSALWDAVKVLGNRLGRRAVGMHKIDGEWKKLSSSRDTRDSYTPNERIIERTEKIVRNEFRFGFSNGQILIAVQRQDTTENRIES
jgi:hypothetical protein